MADEFAKGLGLFAGAGLAFMVLGSWYRTESFESTEQLVAPPTEAANLFDTIGIFLADLFFWIALVGAFAFWVVIPVGRQAYRAYGDRRAD